MSECLISTVKNGAMTFSFKDVNNLMASALIEEKIYNLMVSTILKAVKKIKYVY